MDVIVAVDDEFGVTASEFAHQWNMSADHASVAVARPHTGRPGRFDPGALIDGTLVVLGSLATGVAGNALYDLIKRLLSRQARGREVYYRRTERPDGSSVVEFRLTEPN
ncbi:hypothetical protein GCM10027280_23030 [Micromonospora polyrhachis]|uniref:Uncharacterized protein n=1 Tax=Micromonospora polyrhachis TaxID=1282883 RepID=A0A7W7SX22_9ACTN|nr:hypothetical protein [Micromonospora polyrhachis]MBB4962563.1 hypothetical protein [Micromonospora polyrhachis]